jgi:hypothetical protein
MGLPKHWYYSKPEGTPSASTSLYWKKYRPVNGVVTETLSPFYYRPFKGYFHELTKNFKTTGWTKLVQFGPGAFTAYSIYAYCVWKYDQNNRAHWY